ncbi:metal ABC transporter ATP-binding protein [Leuconostoc fallax]|uniref:ABC transporter domain-containing protein n=1 Tax=Leuconostoc fallax TaxID=1251 RepID=A0A4R5N8R3_9LACO|nr:metal ABC transporter ATP-binding protein [Leuconostoc fallax]MBU7455436.1 metal ABC transporter ATP-binding protein [Leuconostoc fallax]TDG68316.1 hypothetical protein C5L23_000622 [Leuconostoc fallax]
MFKIENLSVGYQNTQILDNLSVEFPSGAITGIIGPNGAGKSTMIKGALGLIKRQNGVARVDQRPIESHREQVAYVEQRANLDLTFPINVFDVVLSGSYGRLGLFKEPSKQDKQNALSALEQVNMLNFKERQIGDLSGGQLQRVFVARAIVQAAPIVILDEPFAGIDMKSESEIMSILKTWRAEGKTIIVVHHDLNKVTDYFDHLIILNRGIVAAGPVAEVYTKDNVSKAFSADLGNVLFTDDNDSKQEGVSHE